MSHRITRRQLLSGIGLGMGAVAMSGCTQATPPVIPPTAEASPPPADDAVREIGSRWELFVDDWLIARLDGAELRLHPPIKREVVLALDRPWEGKWSAYFTALQDGDTVRLYYRGFTPADISEATCTCMAESRDGVHFERPSLGLYEFDGSRQNNIVHRGIESHNLAPFIDRNPQARPEARYKALAGLQSKLYALSSADGLRWQKMQAEPVMTKGAFDSLNVGFWDEATGIYRSYARYWTGGEYQGYRGIQSCTSADFLHWSDPQPNQYRPAVPREHLYTNATIPCPDAPHILLAFPKRFVPERTKLKGYAEPGVSDALFMASRDGVNWSRIFPEAWVRPDLDERNWTHRSNMPAWGIVQTDPAEFTMYISEHYDWPDNRLRRLTIRRHGFASIRAGAGGGACLTRPLRFAGTELVLNYATSAAGAVSIEVQDADGQPLMQSDDLFGNELEGVVRWLGGARLADLAGKPVRLRFTLRDADVYAFRFRS